MTMIDEAPGSLTRRQMLEQAAMLGLTAACWGLSSATLAEPLPFRRSGGAFPLIARGRPAAIMVDPGADTAVALAADSFVGDLSRVSGQAAARVARPADAQGPLVLIGVLGQSPAIDDLVASGRIDPQDLRGEWEAFRQIVVEHPYPGVPRALVIVGSDRRGAVFGTYDLSERMGVSPWHWFADVPVRQQADVYVPAGSRRDQPRVRYRGFFINDEAPAFSQWAIRKFGGANSKMYAHVFELLLRMKGNYLWPAMWAPRAFADDDPHNMVLADAMGVVMGNSHHEPMLRAQDEWHRNTDKGVTGGKWDYTSNGGNLRKFWRGSIERMMSKGGGRGYESLVTVGMRGDGDEAMAEGTATQLLEQIVVDQRAIIADVTGKPASETPQVWALYKEVLDYYDHGMKVPDDVTLLFADDNWGQIRRLPAPGAPPRKGGYGIYYHFDYVGVPRNYKWINTNQIEKTWQQMDLAYQRGARNIWIVNVGDIKPMEYPLGFFLALAWNPEAMTPEALAAYPAKWASATFGAENAAAIGELITRYSQYAARRKPELIDQDSFPLGVGDGPELDGGEFGTMIAEWDDLDQRMMRVRARLNPDQLDAYYEMIEHPISALGNLYRMYYAAAWNKRLADSNDPRANPFADQVEATFRRDGELTDRYNRLRDGKWDGMMNQVHMNYVIWNDPVRQSMPSITRVGGGDSPESRLRNRPRFGRTPPAPAGVIAIEAVGFTRARGGQGLRWAAIPSLGRTRGGVVALPQGRPATTEADGVRVEYDVVVDRAGDAQLSLYLVPTLDTIGHGDVRIGCSIDDGPVRVLTLPLEATGGAQDTPRKQRWAQAVRDNAVMLSAALGALATGRHTVKIWRLDDNAVLQKLVLSTVPVAPSYLGPMPGRSA